MDTLSLPADVDTEMARLTTTVRKSEARYRDLQRMTRQACPAGHRPDSPEMDVWRRTAAWPALDAREAYGGVNRDALNYFRNVVLPAVTGGSEWVPTTNGDLWAGFNSQFPLRDHEKAYRRRGDRYRRDGWKNVILLCEPYAGAVLSRGALPLRHDVLLVSPDLEHRERIEPTPSGGSLFSTEPRGEPGAAWRLPSSCALYSSYVLPVLVARCGVIGPP